jgi:DNA-binding response OmpR family regulator
MEGLEVIGRLRHFAADVPIVAVTDGGAFSTPAPLLAVARAGGATASLPKPFTDAELIDAVAGALGTGAGVTPPSTLRLGAGRLVPGRPAGRHPLPKPSAADRHAAAAARPARPGGGVLAELAVE